MPENRPVSNGGQMTARQMRYRRAQQRRRAQVRFFALSFVCILLLAGVITAFIELPKKIETTETQSSADTSGSQPQTGAEQENPNTENPPQTELTGVLGPVAQKEMTYAVPTAALLAQPENGRVDMAYFDDALFIGDSLTQGFQVYSSGISNAHYAAYVGVGPKQLMEGTVTNLNGESVAAIDEILAASPKKVYILLGTNTLSNLADDAFLKYYEDFLNYLSPQLPADTVYYIQAIPPVTQEKATDENYTIARIQNLNEALANIAYAHGWHYLNIYGALSDENGYLRSDIVEGNDGIHLNGTGYDVWKEYLVTHTAYSADSPYIAGSPYLL